MVVAQSTLGAVKISMDRVTTSSSRVEIGQKVQARLGLGLGHTAAESRGVWTGS